MVVTKNRNAHDVVMNGFFIVGVVFVGLYHEVGRRV